jgi:hypothetical protein
MSHGNDNAAKLEEAAHLLAQGGAVAAGGLGGDTAWVTIGILLLLVSRAASGAAWARWIGIAWLSLGTVLALMRIFLAWELALAGALGIGLTVNLLVALVRGGSYTVTEA